MATTASKTITLEFEFERETKGTIRYAEVEGPEGPMVGTLYVKKFAAARLGNPEKLSVTIEAS